MSRRPGFQIMARAAARVEMQETAVKNRQAIIILWSAIFVLGFGRAAAGRLVYCYAAHWLSGELHGRLDPGRFDALYFLIG